jgi:superfamily II DNA or RNA helicase
MVEALGPRHAGQQFYNVFWGAQGTRTVGEYDLLMYVATTSPTDSLRAGLLSGYAEFQRVITLQRLLREQPLRNNIYAFNASRTQFYAYQFKPLLKFLDSANQRILICDEVGLGKTIEAGLLLLELRARQTLKTILVVCPSNLREKWRLELRQRFGEEFRILQSDGLKQFFADYEENPDRVTLNGIVSLETLRTPQVRQRLDELSIPFDFVVFDEAHHLRNFATSQREAGALITDSAQAVAMLTATPVHLGQENLFSLLNLLDGDDFPDYESAVERFRDNEYVVQAQRALAQLEPDYAGAAALLNVAAQSRWTTKAGLLSAVREKLLHAAEQSTPSVDERDRTLLVSLQRDLSELNLLGHILTRTQKRDVHDHVVARRAQAIEVVLSQRERALYDGVTSLIHQESERLGESDGIRAWRLNTPQRRLASSIQGMVEFYREDGAWYADTDDPDGFSYEDDTALEADDETHLRALLRNLVATWPPNAPDSKYERLRGLLNELRASGRSQKVLVFATFKHTIRYLERRLSGDGFGAVAISGDTPVESRPAQIARFRDDPSTLVMLSSRVGSEGLDFQFCSTVVNYDLPWNPMEVEQRIGRLDRIGQESDTILVVNFWTQDTIEERILKRLYDRIGIFERSIGDLEVILGDIAASVRKELIRASLSPEEAERAVEQVARVIEGRRAEIESLEASAARFVGVDSFFDQEVDAIRMKRRYVTGEQLHRFIVDFLHNHAPRTRLDYDSIANIGALVPDEQLRVFLRQSGVAGEALQIAGGVGTAIPVTFDAQTAFRRPGAEFLSVLHPLVRAIADHHAANARPPAAQHVVLRTSELDLGFYFFFVYRVRITAARSGSVLETVVVTPDGEPACDRDKAETILGEMVERGDSPNAQVEIDPGAADVALVRGEQELLSRLKAMRAAETAANDAFVDQRLASLRSFYDKGIRKKRDLLQRATDAKRQPRYVRMLNGHITRLEAEYAKKEAELESLRTVTTEYDNVAAGVLEIMEPSATA